MQVVDTLTKLVSSVGSALISSCTMKSQAEEAGLNAFSSLTGSKDSDKPAAPASAPVAPTTSPNGVSSQPNAAALSDPGTLLVQQVLDQVNGIKELLTGGEGGQPDWDKIRAKGVRFSVLLSPSTMTLTWKTLEFDQRSALCQGYSHVAEE